MKRASVSREPSAQGSRNRTSFDGNSLLLADVPDLKRTTTQLLTPVQRVSATHSLLALPSLKTGSGLPPPSFSTTALFRTSAAARTFSRTHRAQFAAHTF